MHSYFSPTFPSLTIVEIYATQTLFEFKENALGTKERRLGEELQRVGGARSAPSFAWPTGSPIS